MRTNADHERMGFAAGAQADAALDSLKRTGCGHEVGRLHGSGRSGNREERCEDGADGLGFPVSRMNGGTCARRDALPRDKDKDKDKARRPRQETLERVNLHDKLASCHAGIEGLFPVIHNPRCAAA